MSEYPDVTQAIKADAMTEKLRGDVVFPPDVIESANIMIFGNWGLQADERPPANLIARAILDERTRCEGIARGMRNLAEFYDNKDMRRMGEAISRSILSPKT